MKRIIIMMMLIATLFSCSDDISSARIIVVSAALDYSEEDGFRPGNALDNPPNDMDAFISQLDVLSGMRIEKHVFLSRSGIRTINGEEKEWDEDTILDTIKMLDTESDDLIIFFYSGHGEDKTGNLVLSMKDEGFGMISPDELMYALSTLDGKKCVFLDSCYSGAFVEDAGMLADGEVFGEDGSLQKEGFFSALYPSLCLSLTSGKLGTDDIWVMSAATDSQLSYDAGTDGRPNQDKYGAFSYFLLSAFGYDMEEDTPSVRAGMGEVTFLGLYRTIKEDMARSMWESQTPQITLTPLDLVLF